ncbi:hypothetical protein [Cupriavidus pauculus]|nr:hypothetical protein [Cupriavidus pauculus]
MTTVSSTSSAPVTSESAQQPTKTMSSDIREGHLKSAIPLSEVWAPQFLVKGDLDGNLQLSQDEFVSLLGQASIEKDKALALFKDFGGTEKQGINVDQFVEGIKKANARGETVFNQMTNALFYGKDGKPGTEGLEEFLRAGYSFAESYWTSHRR